jgi:hypothetical protein
MTEIIDLLNDVAEFLEGQSDVDDGSYGEQVPNRAMSLLMAVEQEIERLNAAPQAKTDSKGPDPERPAVAAPCEGHEWSETPVCLCCGIQWKDLLDATTCSPTVNKDDRG